ncbi:hypothetical protein PQX77_018081 [Marasmius sp. AFHP31]|nr:hypothetical protein PQX77_018081 [Marasmius sp. AFHP31]
MFNNSSRLSIAGGSYSVIHGDQHIHLYGTSGHDISRERSANWCVEAVDEEWRVKLRVEVEFYDGYISLIYYLIRNGLQYKRIPLGEIQLLRVISNTNEDFGHPRIDVKRIGHLAHIEDRRERPESFLTISYTGRGAYEVGEIYR